VALGTTTVTVTAIDPGGLSATLDLEVEVVEPVLVFRDDFDSSASLDDWTLDPYGYSSVKDGKLRLVGFATREANAVEWEFKGAMGVGGEDTYVGLSSRGNPRLHFFSIGAVDSFPPFIYEDHNYRLVVWEPGWRTESGWWGTSDAIADVVGEFTEVTFAARSGRLAAMAGSTLLVDIDMFSRDWTVEMAVAGVSAYGDQGFFDWVELNSLEGDADADADWHAGPPDIDLLELVKSGPGVKIPH
jgi:hypothetical protein